MKWEEIIAEARSAGVLAFCGDGIAVLNREQSGKKKETADRLGPQQTSGETGPEGRESGSGEEKSSE